ncbi:MAG: AzlD domain-containing protein [Lautropia sp.]
MNETDLHTLLTIAGLAVVTMVTRSFFFLPERPWPMPAWARRGLNYAPVAALAAVIVPEMTMTDGQFVGTWQDARLYAVLAGSAWYAWRRGVLGTIVAGMAVYLPLHVGLGW